VSGPGSQQIYPDLENPVEQAIIDYVDRSVPNAPARGFVPGAAGSRCKKGRPRKEQGMRLALTSIISAHLVLVCLAAARAQDKQTQEDKSAQPTVIPVWPKDAPGSENWTQKEAEFQFDKKQPKMVRNVVRPTLTAFLPERTKANGTAVIVCPGGGFHFLSWESEGTQVAEWLRSRGVAAFVLKYRLVDTGATEEEFRQRMQAFFKLMAAIQKSHAAGERPARPAEMLKVYKLASEDGRQAVKVVREHAAEWGVQPDRIGIMGFSAGGMVTTAVATQIDASSRPNFAAPIYGPGFDNVKVPSDGPPLFIVCASDDGLVPPKESIRLYSDWKAAGKSAELHIYAKGGHGFGMRKQGLPCDGWIDRFGDWLDQQGLLKPAGGR
jgi:acetyl esterase/lipase